MKRTSIKKRVAAFCMSVVMLFQVDGIVHAETTANSLTYTYWLLSEAYSVSGYTPSANEADFADSLGVKNIFSDEIEGVTYTGPVLEVEDSVFKDHKFNIVYFYNEQELDIGAHAFENVEVKCVDIADMIEFGEYGGSIVFEGDIGTIGNYAFRNIDIGGRLYFQGKIDTIGEYAMANMTMQGFGGDSLYIREIQKGAFSNNADLLVWKKEIQGTEIIGENAFEYCTSLTTVELPDTVTSIGASCYKGCTSLTSVTLPVNANLTIGANAFPNQENLTIIIPTELTDISGFHFDTLTDVVFQIEESTSEEVIQYLETNELQYKVGANGSVVVGSGSVEEEPASTEEVVTTEELTTEESITTEAATTEEVATTEQMTTEVTTTTEEEITEVATTEQMTTEKVVTEETNTTEVPTIPTTETVSTEEVTEGVNENQEATTTESTTEEYNRKEATKEQFIHKENYGVVTITDFIEGLTEVNLGNVFPDATEIIIDKNAFRGNNITKVIIPKSVSLIGESAFQDCIGLHTVIFEERTTEELTFGSNTFYGCENLQKLDIPDTVTSIPRQFCEWCDALTSVDLPASCQSIGDYAFAYSGLTKITIPNTCVSIGERAFYNCDVLASVVFEEGDNRDGNFTMGEYAFHNCKILSSIEIPDGCKAIPDYAFLDCSSLTSITIPDECASIGYIAFSGCTSLNQMNATSPGVVNLPEQCQSVGESAFSSCTSLKTINIPAVCESIGEECFKYCTNLNMVTFINPDTIIASNAFPVLSGSNNNVAINMTIYCSQPGAVTDYADANGLNYTTALESITIIQLPTKTEYFYAEDGVIDTTGMKLVANYTDGEDGRTEEISSHNCSIKGFESNVPGKQTITVQYGDKSTTFDVYVYYNIASAKIEVADVTYTGVKMAPVLTVTGTETQAKLIKNQDYTVTYYDNLNAGTATAIVVGIGLYKGEQTATFNITPRMISEETTTVEVSDMQYTGSQLQPIPKVMYGNEPLILDEDYVLTYGTNINVGQGFVIVEGIGNYDGSIKVWFDINAVPEQESTETGSDSDSENGTENESSNSNNGESTEKDNTNTDNTGSTEVGNTGTNNTGNTENGNTNAGNTGSANTNQNSNANASGSGDAATTETPQQPIEEKPVKGKVYTYKKLRYKVTSDTTVTFVGVADKKLKKLVIPDHVEIYGRLLKVTKISKNACYKNTKITSLEIGNYVTSIDEQAFAKCTKLKKVAIGKGLKKIGKKAFYMDKKLSIIKINSKKLKPIGKAAFKGIVGFSMTPPSNKLAKKYKRYFKDAKK